jgi:hypothetical protein
MRDLVMRVALATLIFISCASPALAQTKPDDKSKSPESTGRSVNEDEKGKMQPQGQTGPLETKSGGGAPASSPQGETPPGMQSAPDGSSKSMHEPKK